MEPFTRGSMMIWRSSITPMARVTASMSAFTKFSVTGVLAFRAGPLLRAGARLGLAVSGWAWTGPMASSTASVVAVKRGFMLIRS